MASNNDWPLAQPRIRMAPSLLSADFARLKDEIQAIEAAGAEVLHLDVMDGHFVPNISFGVPVIEKLRPVSKLFFDTHLMISDPVRYAEAFAKAGSDLLTFHIEVAPEPMAIADHIRSTGARAGITLNPDTPASALRPVIGAMDLVLVMSVWPGFGGQQFIESSLDKLRELRKLLRPDQRLEIDGGIGPLTVQLAVQAGADTLVAGSAIFGQPDPAAAMRDLLRLAETRG
ncbi:MAG TPA: ribulose-phosphate 3-epimerase [Phycisphaerae bacterium]|nr:ribulose-phosphate 3-epimerase [Phycisphaerae bacterium]HRR85061.1 ribulose-phosphate 3-epimerase [Phycisphaerae bacterium]